MTEAIGWLYESTGEWQLALDTYTQALDLARAILRHSMEANLLQRISFIKQKLGNLSGALDSSRSAMDAVEAVRGGKSTHDARSFYLSGEQPVYDDNIQLLMRLDSLHPGEHYSSLALQTSERARARSLLEMLSESHADIRQGADPALLERERSIQHSLEAKSQVLERMLNGPKADANAEAARNEILGLLSDYQEVEAKIRLTGPRYAALTQPHPLSVSEIQRDVLDDDTALIEYHLAPGNSFMWFVTRDSVYARQLTARQIIEIAARRVYDLLASRNHREKFEEDDEKSSRIAKADGEFAVASAALTNLILSPIADLLGGKKRLFIVADGALQYVPFAALPDPGSPARDPLVVQHEIVCAPSASVVALIRRDSVNRPIAQNKIAVLADPVFSDKDPRVKGARADGKGTKSGTTVPSGVTGKASRTDIVLRSAAESGAAGRNGVMDRLPYSRKEADAIASLVSKNNAMVAMDFDASKTTATDSSLGSFRYVHFATHSLLNSTHPELSGLVFSLVDANGADLDGFLQAHEVYNLKLPVDMVVLSACNTGLGKEISGEGIVGITRGFMYAGASRVLVSQWRVADDATAELMARMYSGILGRKNLRPLAALREAQIGMWKDKRWSFPYYWSGFVMQGEWR
jgi:CHAT domain-containing protein